MAVSFSIISNNIINQYSMTNKISDFFNAEISRKTDEIIVLIDDDWNYVIKIINRSIKFIINDFKENLIDELVDKAIKFINNEYRYQTIGFKNYSSKYIIPISKFKNIDIIEI